jgi:tetratricopeptide (TPR) repeat protein
VAAERAQESNPVNPRIAEREAEPTMEIGDRDRAQGAYERAVRLNPEQCAPYILIAKFHQRRSKIEQSLVCYRKARILSPLDEELEQSESQLRERSDRK